MCGIIGIIKKDGSDVVPDIISSLKRLEYRGYDSSGVAILNEKQEIVIQKAVGKIEALEKSINKISTFSSAIGIGHTRWATHGKVTEHNSHPHYTDKVAVIHNGIIENYKEIRKMLSDKGYKFKTETDTESIAILLTYFLDSGFSLRDAFTNTLIELEGTYAIAAVFAGESNIIAVAKVGSPMAIGATDNNNVISVGSDVLALTGIATKAIILKDGDYAILEAGKEIEIMNNKEIVTRDSVAIDSSSDIITKEGHDTFMMKEIYQQPVVLGGIINHYLEVKDKVVFDFPKFNFDLADLESINIIACGTSYYAGLTSSYYFSKYSGINVNMHIASEFRYMNYNFKKGGVSLFISQSGETADTIAALKHAKANKQKIVSIVNSEHSTIANLSDVIINCHAGPEIGVASTKAFTAQLTLLIMFALRIGLKNGNISRTQGRELANTLLTTGGKVASALHLNDTFKEVSKALEKARNIMFIGRNTSYGVALEGALKMKELSYIPSDAIPSGELKHGPIALVDKHMPIIAVAAPDHMFSKVASNIEEIIARDGNVILISDKYGCRRFADSQNVLCIAMPEVHEFIAPIVYSVAVQLLAYHTATSLGHDIDKPRNLAKSVTVE